MVLDTTVIVGRVFVVIDVIDPRVDVKVFVLVSTVPPVDIVIVGVCPLNEDTVGVDMAVVVLAMVVVDVWVVNTNGVDIKFGSSVEIMVDVTVIVDRVLVIVDVINPRVDIKVFVLVTTVPPVDIEAVGDCPLNEDTTGVDMAVVVLATVAVDI